MQLTAQNSPSSTRSASRSRDIRSVRQVRTVVTVMGTRPEVIKLSPVVRELARRKLIFNHVVVATAQHRHMLDQALSAFGMRADFDLGVMEPNQSLARLTANTLLALTGVFAEIRPDAVLVQGDTTTAMTASLAAFYQGIPVGHIEAGLRSFQAKSPFPEEVNRRIVACIADMHFAPTERARLNLLGESVLEEAIVVTGNTIVDALNSFSRSGPFEDQTLGAIDFGSRRVLLVTAHRRENQGLPLLSICRALRILACRFPEIEIVYPVHRNPNIYNPVHAELANHPRIRLIPPVAYADFLRLLSRSYLVLTDSGGIQEEAPSFGKPVLILRDVTERPEMVEAGTGRVVGTDTDRIVTEAARLLNDPTEYQKMCGTHNPFGDGRAAQRIVDALEHCLTFDTDHASTRAPGPSARQSAENRPLEEGEGKGETSPWQFGQIPNPAD